MLFHDEEFVRYFSLFTKSLQNYSEAYTCHTRIYFLRKYSFKNVPASKAHLNRYVLYRDKLMVTHIDK